VLLGVPEEVLTARGLTINSQMWKSTSLGSERIVVTGARGPHLRLRSSVRIHVIGVPHLEEAEGELRREGALWWQSSRVTTDCRRGAGKMAWSHRRQPFLAAV
jgi:hypothetical protein